MTASSSNGWWQRIRRWLRRHAVTIVIVSLVLALLFLIFSPSFWVTIGPGEAGVLWKRFDEGVVTVADDGQPFVGRIQADKNGNAITMFAHMQKEQRVLGKEGLQVYPYLEGTHFIWPWDRMYIYNVRLQMVSHEFSVLTNDGLEVKTQVTITWKPVEADLGLLHRDVGPDYVNVLLIPTIGSCAREEIARHKPEDLYSEKRLQIQDAIKACAVKVMLSDFYPAVKRQSYFMVEDVLIRNVSLPPTVRAAIEQKVRQKEIAESYVYILDRERMEAERKAIEAEGIRRFQATVNSTISDSYLRWKGIDATLELAKSPNAKIVVIGAGGKDGLPVILGGLDNGPAPPAARAPTGSAQAAPSTWPSVMSPSSAVATPAETALPGAGPTVIPFNSPKLAPAPGAVAPSGRAPKVSARSAPPPGG